MSAGSPAVSTLPAVAQLREIMKDGEPSSWDLAWKANVTPWDSGKFQPPLKEVVESGDIAFPHQGRALVPGCGSGYDVFYLASALKLDSLGLDISETAIEKANSILNTLDFPPNAGKATFSLDNFFHLQPPEEQFDLIYDYTFFVAIPPSKRREWGDKMASLIKAGGYLITLVFPIDPPTDLGPPFFVRVEHYEEVLAGSFEKVLDKIPTSSLPTHLGKERIAVWRRI